MSIAKDIFTGNHDDELDDIAEALRQRRETINRAKLFELSVGDTVQFNDQTKPRYLQGLKGVIKSKNRKTIVVDLLSPYRSAQGKTWYRGIKVPLSLVDAVDEPDKVQDAFNRITANA